MNQQKKEGGRTGTRSLCDSLVNPETVQNRIWVEELAVSNRLNFKQAAVRTDQGVKVS